MRVLLVTDSYPPEVGSGAHLMAELADELAARGHDVRVLTTWPEYKLAEGEGRRFQEMMCEGAVRVLRVKTMALHNVGFVRRGIGVLVAPFQLALAVRRHGNFRFDAVFVYSPPLTFSFVGEWFKRRGARYVLNVQDIFPQNAIDLGVMKNRQTIAFFEWIERRAYRMADIITAHSEGNRQLLMKAHPGDAGKMSVLHNWIDPSQFLDGEPAEDFRKTYGLEGKFIAVYGGVLGPAQGLDFVLDLAARLRDLPDLVFLLVGDGMEKARLEKRARDEGLSNVVFRPFVSRERYPSLVKSSDIGFLSLSAQMKTPVVPGKILGFMAAALPVAAFVNQESDAHTIIRDAQCGFSCTPGQLGEAERQMRACHADRAMLVAKGRNGQRYAMEHFRKDVVINQIESYLD